MEQLLQYQKSVFETDRKEMKIVYFYYVLNIINKSHLLIMKNAKAIAGELGI